VPRAATRSATAAACVIGDVDLVRPLLLAGVHGAVAAPPWKPARASRFCRARLWEARPWDHEDKFRELLLEWASTQDEPPVLFYEGDADLVFVSRHRAKLGSGFRFVVADEDVVESLVDKARFHEFAATLGLPVPRSIVLSARSPRLGIDDVRFPAIVKPARSAGVVWRAAVAEDYVKAQRVSDADQVSRLRDQMADEGASLIVQELVAGDETQIESYHVYVDAGRSIVADFTGRKIRTLPRSFGTSTALCLTDAPDVRELGRELTRRIGLVGVAKFDFKRDADGRLWLLEVNPRFNLWHHLGALGGVNLPALVYADLTGGPRPAISSTPKLVRWSLLGKDASAARQHGMSYLGWMRSVVGYEIKSPFAWDDPLPFLGLLAWRTRVWLSRHNVATQA
jgi:predicted ATP-grasp superfamily ATP-dependent carboligase